MHRVLINPDMACGDTVAIPAGEALHHLRRVLRARAGDTVECVDGQGRLYRGPLVAASDRELTVRIDVRLEEPAPRLAITLAHAMIKPDHFEWAIQKATELGVARIIPLAAVRCTVRLGARNTVSAARLARWRRIIELAVVQCGRARVPVIDPPQTVADAVAGLRGAQGLFLTPSEQGEPIAAAVREIVGSTAATIFIGPEGDFSPEEVALAKRAGLAPVRLGPQVLRAETAAVAAIVVLQCLAGDWHA